MKNKNTPLLIAVAVIVAAAIYFLTKKKGNDGAPDWLTTGIDAIKNIFSGGAKYPGTVSKSESDTAFMKSLGYGDIFISMFSAKDKAIFRNYVENYARKGIALVPTDPIYKDVVRINSYANVFPNVPKS